MAPALPNVPELRADGPGDDLAIYVRDHLAASSGGLELLRRTLGHNRGTPYEPPVELVLDETRLDQEALERLADHLGISRSWPKQAATWLGEKVARAKRNGRLVGYSPLARLWELEQLKAAVTTKTALWIVMTDPRMANSVPDDLDADAVRRRCQSHIDLMEEFRHRAAMEAFRPDST